MYSRPLSVTLVIGALTLLAACAGTPSGSSVTAEAPVYRVGDRWVYHAEDGYRVKTIWDETHEVIAIGADGITVRITAKGPSTDFTRVEQWSAPVLVKVGAVYDNETRRFTQPLQRYDFPMADGKVWDQRVDNYNEATKKVGNINRYVRVRGQDKVTTSAGTFDAVSMQVIMRLDDDEFWRYATECNYLVWYAPEVRGVVREEKNAQYLEKGGGSGSGGSVIRTQNTVLTLISFVAGK
jgi:hypothetical protein